MIKLGVNVDHVATVREARGEHKPDPITAARMCEKAGADSIVAHLREDRRHINDRDISLLRKTVQTRLNLEMSINPNIVHVALRIKPDQSTLVPEKRQELTTEGGLDVVSHFTKIQKVTSQLQKKSIVVNLFIDPVKKQIAAAAQSGANAIELHTGRYARCKTQKTIACQLRIIKEAVSYAHSLGLVVNAGHGLNYKNARAIARIKYIEELNIGHSIISRAVFVGLSTAVKEMRRVIQ